MRTNKKYFPEEVFPLIEFKSDDIKYIVNPYKVFFRRLDWVKQSRMFDGDMIKLTSSRLRTFCLKGVCCVSCGVQGLYFVKEKVREKDNFHLNFYALDNNYQEVLMTKDHILPKSLGGKNHIDNYQTMCSPCNNKKGNSYVG